MPDASFADHLAFPRGVGHVPEGAFTGSAGGSICGDLVAVRLRVRGGIVEDAGFDAAGCGALTAAGSALVERVRGGGILEAARVGMQDLSGDLGGLSTGKLHAADLVADAFHQALGAAVRAHGALPADRSRVLVAMSGGVDSAVAALLSAEGGQEAVAVTLELWRDPENDAEASCCSASAVRRARALAHGMGLPHLTLDLRAEFRAGVVDPWLADHAAGRTPNPCVRCNGHVRLDAMLDLAGQLGCAGGLATGHYARTTGDGLLRAAADPAKDQAYMLARLDPASIARLRFPLGELTKPQVRERAAAAGLAVARTPDSQDLCFLAGTGRERFLARHGGLEEAPGPIVDRAGAVLGRHRGAHGLTVGQRRGLGLGGTAEPQYVLATDVAANTVTVGPKAALATDRVALRELTLHRPPAAVDAVRLRYRSRPVPCALEGDEVRLAAPLPGGAAPGQLACLLQGDVVVGAGTIA
jgi:tRNA-specific 2-thiouridylase